MRFRLCIDAAPRLRQHIADGRTTITTPTQPEDTPSHWATYGRGLIDAAKLPGWMVVASMTGFGALVNSADMSMTVAVVATIFIWGLPGQVAFVEFFLLGTPVFSLLLVSSLANIRFLPMSLSLVPLFRGSKIGWRFRYLWTFMMSVNTWVGLLRKVPDLTQEQRWSYYFGYSTVCMGAGAIASAIGYILADTLPFPVTITLVLLNPVYFAFVFAATRSRAAALALIAGAVTGPPLYLLTPEWSLPICGIIAGTAGFYADRWLNRRAA